MHDYAVQIVWSEDDQAYLAGVLELPGCWADGGTQEEALQNLKVIASEWVETAKELKRPIPQPMTLETIALRQMELQKQNETRIEQEVKAAVDQLASALRAIEQQGPSRLVGLRSFNEALDPAQPTAKFKRRSARSID